MAFVVLAAVGFDTSGYSFPYVAGWAGEGKELWFYHRRSRLRRTDTAKRRCHELTDSVSSWLWESLSLSVRTTQRLVVLECESPGVSDSGALAVRASVGSCGTLDAGQDLAGGPDHLVGSLGDRLDRAEVKPERLDLSSSTERSVTKGVRLSARRLFIGDGTALRSSR